MIAIEKLINTNNESADLLADSIIALMRKAYENGYEEGYAAGHSERKGLLTDYDLDAAFKDGQQEGYSRGLEDGYDEACMDLTDDDLCGADEEEGDSLCQEW